MIKSKQAKAIELALYDPIWPQQFEDEARAIKAALGDNCIAVHHVGSTSVPGLLAKPKIDMLVEVHDPTPVVMQLEAIGMEYMGEHNIPLHYGFRKRDTTNVNVHLYQEGHPEIKLNLIFRDYLRKHPSARDEYATLKKHLVQDPVSFEVRDNALFAEYTLKKGDFIREVLQKAGFDRLRMLRCTDEVEWKAAQRFRQMRGVVPDLDKEAVPGNGHEHFVLYKGIAIIGYAHIQLFPDALAAVIHMLTINLENQAQAFEEQFRAMIANWLAVKGYRLT